MLSKKKIFLWLLAIILIAGGVYYFVRPATVHFATVQGAGPNNFIAQIIDIYGLDKKHGLNIIFEYDDPSESIAKLQSGKVETGMTPPLMAAFTNINSNPEEKRIKIFGPLLWNPQVLAVPGDSPLRTLSDLRGKKFGILPERTPGYTNMDIVARFNGFDLKNDFNLTFGSEKDLFQILLSGGVDFAEVSEPRASKYIANGQLREITSLNKMWEDISGQSCPYLQIGAYESWVGSHKKEAKAMLEIFLEANRMVNDNPGLIEKHKDLLGLETAEEIDLAKARIPFIFPTEWNDAAVGNIDLFIKKGVEAGQLPKMPDNAVVLFLE